MIRSFVAAKRAITLLRTIAVQLGNCLSNVFSSSILEYNTNYQSQKPSHLHAEIKTNNRQRDETATRRLRSKCDSRHRVVQCRLVLYVRRRRAVDERQRERSHSRLSRRVEHVSDGVGVCRPRVRRRVVRAPGRHAHRHGTALWRCECSILCFPRN